MSTPPLRLERRAGQRFPFLIPVSLRQPKDCTDSVGFTQDLSSRGVFFFCDAALTVGSLIELTLRMPSEITLGVSMPVRCKGRVLRIVRPIAPGLVDPSASTAEAKVGVAVRLEEYEYLPECKESFVNFSRVASLHSHADEDRPFAQVVPSRIVG
jgi:PilZ domain